MRPRLATIVARILVLATAAFSSAASQAPSRAPAAAAADRPSARYTITLTQNIWTSLLLDSSTGRIWQVHFAVSDSAFAGRLPLNEEALVPPAAGRVGRFVLQETQNIFTFLLLDQDDGRVWQLQWSNDAKTRGIMRQLSKPPTP